MDYQSFDEEPTYKKYIVPVHIMKGNSLNQCEVAHTVSKKDRGKRCAHHCILQTTSGFRLLPCKPDEQYFENKSVDTKCGNCQCRT